LHSFLSTYSTQYLRAQIHRKKVCLLDIERKKFHHKAFRKTEEEKISSEIVEEEKISSQTLP